VKLQRPSRCLYSGLLERRVRADVEPGGVSRRWPRVAKVETNYEKRASGSGQGKKTRQ
jgi:hypothetical protein